MAALRGLEELATGVAEADAHKAGIDVTQVMALAFASKIDRLEPLYRLIDKATRARDRVLREIERRRSALGERLRARIDDDVVDAEVVGSP